MSRIGWAIRDTMSIENDAPRVNVWERGRPSFQLLLNARASNPGHSYLRLLRRKCLLPSAPRVRLRTLNRTSYESRNAMTNVPTAARAASVRPIPRRAPRARSAAGGIAAQHDIPWFHSLCQQIIEGCHRILQGCGKRNNCKHLFANHTLDPANNGAPAAMSKNNGANSSAESAPKREWQSKNVDGREKCPQVSWPSHPTCQRDG